LNPEVWLHTDRETPEESASRVTARLEEMGYLPRVEESAYSEEEEEMIRERLANLGYL